MLCKNYTVDKLVLTVINDHDGSRCGYSHAKRMEAAKDGGHGTFWYMAKIAARESNTTVTNAQISEAASNLAEYYRGRVKEPDSPKADGKENRLPNPSGKIKIRYSPGGFVVVTAEGLGFDIILKPNEEVEIKVQNGNAA